MTCRTMLSLRLVEGANLLRRLAANETVQSSALVVFGEGAVIVWLLVLIGVKYHWWG